MHNASSEGALELSISMSFMRCMARRVCLRDDVEPEVDSMRLSDLSWCCSAASLGPRVAPEDLDRSVPDPATPRSAPVAVAECGVNTDIVMEGMSFRCTRRRPPLGTRAR